MRAELCEDLQQRIAEALRLISGGSEGLQFAALAASPPDFIAALRTSRDDEIRLRTTVTGPHRDDIAILLGGRHAASFASEGQQRSIVLAMKLAQARRLEVSSASAPLFLIDDIFGELDPARRNNLAASSSCRSSKLVTATSFDCITDPETLLASRRDGTITKS